MIRLRLLTPKSALFKRFSQYGFNDKDEISLEIIKEFHKYKTGASQTMPNYMGGSRKKRAER